MSENEYNIQFESEDIFEIHPICKNDPTMRDEQLKAFKLDLIYNSQQVPVILIERNGKRVIIDGKNRYYALKTLGMPIKYIVKDIKEKELKKYRFSLNKQRIKYTKSMLAAYAAEEKKDYIAKKRDELREKISRIRNGEKPVLSESGDTHIILSEIWGVNHDYINKAEHIMENDPALFSQVKEGSKNITDAYNLIKLIETKSPENLKIEKEDKTKISEMWQKCESTIKREANLLEKEFVRLLEFADIPSERATRFITSKLTKEFQKNRPVRMSEEELMTKYVNELKKHFQREYSASESTNFNKKIDALKVCKKDPKGKTNLEDRIALLKKELKETEAHVLEKIIIDYEEQKNNPIPKNETFWYKIRDFIRSNYPITIEDDPFKPVLENIMKIAELNNISIEEYMNKLIKLSEERNYAK